MTAGPVLGPAHTDTNNWLQVGTTGWATNSDSVTTHGENRDGALAAILPTLVT